jgi:adenylate cyclase
MWGKTMTQEGLKRKLTVILSADAEGYSRLMGANEESTIRTLTRYIETMTQCVQHHRGRVVDAPGDNLLAEFASVVDAVGCAAAIQKKLFELNAKLPAERQMQFRIGINLGDVVEEGDSRKMELLRSFYLSELKWGAEASFEVFLSDFAIVLNE